MKTRVTELLGIRYSIIQGGMSFCGGRMVRECREHLGRAQSYFQ